jgi:hypothetical protein
MALHKETLTVHRFGCTMNANIAECHVPVNADLYDIKVIFVDEPDDRLGMMDPRRDRRRCCCEKRQRGLSRGLSAKLAVSGTPFAFGIHQFGSRPKLSYGLSWQSLLMHTCGKALRSEEARQSYD